MMSEVETAPYRTAVPIENLITKFYCAHVLGQSDPKDVVAEMKAAFQDPLLRAEAQARLDQLDHHASVRGDLSQHDFCGHIERIGLSRALNNREPT